MSAPRWWPPPAKAGPNSIATISAKPSKISLGRYYWMAGNFLKYGASDINGKAMNASDLPVDSHELIALCAPRPCFLSVGVESAGDPKWIDAAGIYRAGILASPVYALLGKQGYGNNITDWVHAPLPPVGTLMGEECCLPPAQGGHTSGPNVPVYFDWVGNFIKSPAAPAAAPGAALTKRFALGNPSGKAGLQTRNRSAAGRRALLFGLLAGWVAVCFHHFLDQIAAGPVVALVYLADPPARIHDHRAKIVGNAAIFSREVLPE